MEFVDITDTAVEKIVRKYSDITMKRYIVMQHHCNRHIYVDDAAGRQLTIRLAEGTNYWPSDSDRCKKHRREIFGYEMLGQLPYLQCPKVLGFDASKEIIPLQYLVLTYTSGEDLRSIFPSLSPPEQLAILRQLGQVFATLHNVQVDVASLPEDALRYESFSERINIFAKQLSVLAQERINAILAYHAERLQALHRQQVFIHGDFSFRNVLMQPSPDGWQISGLIDMDMAGVGDRGYELWDLEIYDFRNMQLPGARQAFIDGYGAAMTRTDYQLIYLLSAIWEDATQAHFIKEMESDDFSPDLVWMDYIFN